MESLGLNELIVSTVKSRKRFLVIKAVGMIQPQLSINSIMSRMWKGIWKCAAHPGRCWILKAYVRRGTGESEGQTAHVLVTQKTSDAANTEQLCYLWLKERTNRNKCRTANSGKVEGPDGEAAALLVKTQMGICFCFSVTYSTTEEVHETGERMVYQMRKGGWGRDV